jgi:hypothetical protein
MSIFMQSNHFDKDFWQYTHMKAYAKQLLLQQQNTIQICQDFLQNLDKTQAELLYQKVTAVWSKVTGGFMFIEGTALEFGKKMVDCHLDDPLVHQTILSFKAGQDPELNLKVAECQISPKGIEITGADAFETKCTIVTSEDPLVQARIAIAFRAFSYAARRMPFSANKLTEENCPLDFKKCLHQISSRTCELQADSKLVSSKEPLLYQKKEYPNPFTLVLAKAKKEKKTAIIGNCFEVSTCAQEYSFKEKILEKHDLCHVKGGDHAFYVIGKGASDLPNDFKTWNKKAVVCDVWERTIFPVSSLLENLLEFTNPQTQSLALVNSNFFSAEDFRSSSSCSMPAIEALLQDFHAISMEERSQRLAKARQIVETIENLPLAHAKLLQNEGLSALLSQMRYLLELQGSPFERVKEKIWIFNPDFDPSSVNGNEASESTAFFQALENVKKPGDFVWPDSPIGAEVFLAKCPFYQSPSTQPECIAFIHAFTVAERINDPDLIRMAIKKGAIPDKNAIVRALYVSKKKKNIDFLQAVLDGGAHINEQTFYIATIIARKTKNIEYLKKVMDHGAKASEKDDSYLEALKASIDLSNPDFLDCAIRGGATPSSEAISLACERTFVTGKIDLVTQLLSTDPDVKPTIRYCLKEYGKACGVPSAELRQNLVQLVALNGRDFFATTSL